MSDKLSAVEAIRHWQANDAAKAGRDRQRDVEGLGHGLYGDLPVWINRYYDTFQSLVMRDLVARAALPADFTALEIGCGGGRWCRRLAARPHRAILGLDLSAQQLAVNQRLGGRALHYAIALANELPIASQSLDLLTSVTVLHHLPPAEQDVALAEAVRVLKPGGHVIAFESIETHASSRHLYPRPAVEWRALFERHGFQVVVQRGQEFIDFRRLVRPVRRLLKRLRGGAAPAAGAEPSPPGHASGAERQGLVERLFYLPFFPLVVLSYPLELLAMHVAPPSWASYTCLLARR